MPQGLHERTVGLAAVPRPGALVTVKRVRGARFLRVGILLIADLSALLLAGALAYLLWAKVVRNQPAGVYVELLALLPLFPLAYARWGLYPGFGLGPVELLRRLSLGSGFIFVLVASFSFVLRVPHHYSRMSFLIAAVGTLILAPIFRLFVLSYSQRWSWWPEPVLLVGTGELVRDTVASLRDAVSLGYRPVGIVTPHTTVPSGRLCGLPVLGSVRDAAGYKDPIRVVLVAAEREEVSGEMFDLLQRDFPHVIWIRSQDAVQVEGVGVRNLGRVLGIEFINQLLRRRNRLVKRSLDISLGAIGLALVAPVIGVGLLAVKLVDGGPGLFSQERRGLHERPFRVWKIRTMYVDAEERLSEHLNQNPKARNEWDTRCKLREDPRVLPWVGRVFRRFSIDELPQLWNVIVGEMSLVGPRPFPSYHLERFSASFRDLRMLVRPGLTGLWQVMSRSDGDLDDQEEYDTYYIRNWSLWLDLYLVAKTTLAVLSGRGAR